MSNKLIKEDKSKKNKPTAGKKIVEGIKNFDYKKITSSRLFLPILCLLIVLLANLT